MVIFLTVLIPKEKAILCRKSICMKRTIFFNFSVFILGLIFIIPVFSLTHTVEQGETFYGISRKYGISVSELCSANKLTTNDVLKPGQKLTIPSKAENKSEKSSGTKATSTEKSNEAKVGSYTVQKGETLYSLAKRFETSVGTLQAMNAMSGNDIKEGQVISVPMSSASVASSKATSSSASSVLSSASYTTSASSNSSSKTQSSKTELEELEDLRMTDSRTYDKSKTANKNLKWPVSPKEIQYVTGKVSGVAITTNENESVKSISEGTVMFCGVYRGFGNVVFVQNKSGYMYVYSNLGKISVNEGDSITVNQKLGNVSVDTRNGKSQLMFMVFKGSDPIDPSKAPRA